MTNWFASTSLKNTSCPVSGHLIQRFSGVSRRLRMLRIFGLTTFEIQFMQGSGGTSGLGAHAGDAEGASTEALAMAATDGAAATVLVSSRHKRTSVERISWRWTTMST